MNEDFDKAKKELIEIGKKISATGISKQELKELKKRKREVLLTVINLDKAHALMNIEQTKIDLYKMDMSQKKKNLSILLLFISLPIIIIITVSIAVIVPSLAPTLIPIACVVVIIFICIVRTGKLISDLNRSKKRKKRIESYYEE